MSFSCDCARRNFSFRSYESISRNTFTAPMMKRQFVVYFWVQCPFCLGSVCLRSLRDLFLGE